MCLSFEVLRVKYELTHVVVELLTHCLQVFVEKEVLLSFVDHDSLVFYLPE